MTQSALGETTLAVPWGLRAEGSDQRSPRGPSLREAVPPSPPERRSQAWTPGCILEAGSGETSPLLACVQWGQGP